MNENSSYNILIVDFSLYRDSICAIYQNEGYRFELCESAYDAMAKLKSHDFHLIISEVELPGDNAFDLYGYVQGQYPYIPMIMTTEKNIDTFFDRIFEEGIGNVLCKPIVKDEILNLTEKLIKKKNIFGLTNYIRDISDIKKIRISQSKQIHRAIDIIINSIMEWCPDTNSKMLLTLVLHELAINAVYHSHGLTKEKENRVPVSLGDGQYVDMFFGRSEDKFGISINDYNGKLSKTKILDSINRVIEQEQLIERAATTGEDILCSISETGRGIDLVRKLSGEYYFIIKKGIRTEIIIIFSKNFNKDDNERFSSLKIIEDYPD